MKNKGYGTVTLISTVIGTVIGSGIFFKSDEILEITNGNALLGLLAFVACGGVMLACASTFAVLSAERESRWGIVGYAESMCGAGFARCAAVFSADFYLPSMTAALALVSAKYFCALIGVGDEPTFRIAVAGMLLIMLFSLNTLAPRWAAGFQIGSTAVKLLPLIAVGSVGCAALFSGQGASVPEVGGGEGFMSALLSAAFAYEGWIAVTMLGGGSEETKRKIPTALVLGSLAVLLIYIFYFIGVVGISGGRSETAFSTVFGPLGGRLMLAFVTVSCLGALNGLTMSTVRGHYILSSCLRSDVREKRLFDEVSEKTGMPVLSGVMGLLISEIWLIYGVVAELWVTNGSMLDPSEASVSVMYAIYIPIFLAMTVKCRHLPPIKRYVLPMIAAVAALFVALASPIAFGMPMLFFVISAALTVGAILLRYRR